MIGLLLKWQLFCMMWLMKKLNESEEAGLKRVDDYLTSLHISSEEQMHILHIISNMSYKGGHGGKVETLEGKKLFKMQIVLMLLVRLELRARLLMEEQRGGLCTTQRFLRVKQ
ncbi:hypothetical protein GCM10020331_065860 [Ectobacillus funiculus]